MISFLWRPRKNQFQVRK